MPFYDLSQLFPEENNANPPILRSRERASKLRRILRHLSEQADLQLLFASVVNGVSDEYVEEATSLTD